MQFTSALCAMCDRALQGKQVPEEQLREYMLAKSTKVDVSMLVLRQEERTSLKNKFSLRSMTGEFMKALGFPKPEPPKEQSTVVSDKKRRPRLFSNVELGKEEKPK